MKGLKNAGPTNRVIFGEMEVYSNALLDNPWRYFSKRFDPETGFLYFGHRYYDPEIGRWTTPDPEGFADGPNLYSYAHNHPLAYIDPDGRFVWLLAPLAISIAAEYCLPAAVLCLEPYVCAEFGGFLTGLVNGFNTNFFESAAAETLGYHNLGMTIGASLNLLPGRTVANIATKGCNLVANIATKELSTVATNTIATKSSKWFSWFRSTSAPINQATQKTAQVAEKYIAKEGGQLSKQNPSHKISQLEGKLSEWLGKDNKMIKNKAGDSVLLSKDGTRKIRFDLNHPAPHSNPHGHIEEFINGKWNKSGPIYPIDVLHY